MENGASVKTTVMHALAIERVTHFSDGEMSVLLNFSSREKHGYTYVDRLNIGEEVSTYKFIQTNNCSSLQYVFSGRVLDGNNPISTVLYFDNRLMRSAC